MKIVALYKCFSGGEWLEASICSIYDHVEKIVVVQSDISWIGTKGNDCRPVIRKLKKQFDTVEHQNLRKAEGKVSHSIIEPKIIELECNTIDQLKQCAYGYNYIKKQLSYMGCDWVQFIDADEVWDETAWKNALEGLESPKFGIYRTNLHQYIKSPYYRIQVESSVKPVCFVRPDFPDLGRDARACTLDDDYPGKKQNILETVRFHHFSHVRLSFNRVMEKIVASHLTEACEYVDMSKWIPEVWNKIPKCKNGFHPNVKFQRLWQKILHIEKTDLPEVLQNNEFEIMEINRDTRI